MYEMDSKLGANSDKFAIKPGHTSALCNNS